MLDGFYASLTGHMLSDVPGGNDSLDLISLLEKENLFLVPLDSERMWYRYHHLFQNLLVHHLKDLMPPEQKAEMYRRAAAAAPGLLEENLHAIIDGDLSRRRLKRLPYNSIKNKYRSLGNDDVAKEHEDINEY